MSQATINIVDEGATVKINIEFDPPLHKGGVLETPAQIMAGQFMEFIQSRNDELSGGDE